jgi:integrase
MPERPVPEQVMTELSNYVATLPEGQERLITDRFTSKKWNRVRERVRMPELKFHDLRKTFASLLAQRGVSTAVTQRLLEHSSPRLTNDVYTNVDPVRREAVDLLPVGEWLQSSGCLSSFLWTPVVISVGGVGLVFPGQPGYSAGE